MAARSGAGPVRESVPNCVKAAGETQANRTCERIRGSEERTAARKFPAPDVAPAFFAAKRKKGGLTTLFRERRPRRSFPSDLKRAKRSELTEPLRLQNKVFNHRPRQSDEYRHSTD